LAVTNADLASSKVEGNLIQRECAKLEARVRAELYFALQYPELELRKLHTTAWNRLWFSGVTLSHSFAPGVLNGKHINATLYYLVSNTPDRLSIQTNINKTVVDEYKLRARSRYNCSTGSGLLLKISLFTQQKYQMFLLQALLFCFAVAPLNR
uniref:Transmembrane protein 231 n=1 Tax=Echinostoma caproni TaxID=27848 RepID=A0A183AG34_9TREM